MTKHVLGVLSLSVGNYYTKNCQNMFCSKKIAVSFLKMFGISLKKDYETLSAKVNNSSQHVTNIIIRKKSDPFQREYYVVSCVNNSVDRTRLPIFGASALYSTQQCLSPRQSFSF